ncbi:MAG: sugar phosphate isomerase/epimerase [Chloroflexota bacterium]|nr:sugar phosphate isomerase/epimerase [Chloroflexota bacterium]
MTLPIALQTYTVRDLLEDDFEGVMRRVAGIGYAGVETTFTIPGTTLANAAATLRDLGLEVVSAHVPLPLGDDKNAVLDYVATFGLDHIVAMKGPEDFESSDTIRRVCDLFNEAQAVCAANGLELSYHNHWWEFLDIEGRNAFDIFLECLSPAVNIELDTYWVQAAGIDPESIVRQLGDRAPLLHIKDGPAKRDVPQLAVGDGVLDWAGIIGAADEAQWLIIELDHCATDMLTAVEKSFDYLVAKGLGHGSKA